MKHPLLRRKKQNRAAFTLIEMMVVLALIGLSVSALQFGIGTFLKQEAFSAEVGKIKNALILSAEFMMDTGSDITLTMVHNGECVHLVFATHVSLPEKLGRQFTDLSCKQIKKLYFDGQEKEEVILHFDGHHGQTSKGRITLENKKGERRSLTLTGFPGKVLT